MFGNGQRKLLNTTFDINGVIGGTCDLTTTAEAAVSAIQYRWISSTDCIPNDGQDITAFSSWTTSPVALPIILLYFQTKRENENVKLTWATLNEKNNAGFAVEQSSDALTFEQIAFVDGAGYSTSVRKYDFSKTYLQSAYYRLKQIDFDGKFSYSSIQYVSTTEGQEASIIFPNPTKGNIMIANIDGNEQVIVTLFTLTGKSLTSLEGKKYIVEHNLSKKLSQLAYGTYIVRLQTSKKVHNIRVVKQ